MRRFSTLLWVSIALAGCCSCPDLPVEVDVPVLDVHAHVFNARYLPVAGIIKLKVQEHDLGLSDDFCEMVARILHRWTPDGPIGNGARTEVVERRLEGEERAALEGALGETALDAPSRRSDEALMIEVLDHVHFLEDVDHDAGAEESVVARLAGLLRFVATLLSHEERVVQRMEEAFDGQPTLYVHHMMDMARTYADATPWSFQPEQVDRVRRLSEAAGGRLLAFVAWDPFRTGDPLDAVKYGVARGCVGVKFYPPSGYRPSGNVIQPPARPDGAILEQWQSRYARLPGSTLAEKAKHLDRLNARLFAYCAEQGLPILTHCSRGGFEASRLYGRLNCDPSYWIKPLKDHPGLSLCFGHAGGYEGWRKSHEWEVDKESLGQGSGKDFEQKVFELCLAHEGVYCEFGYHNFGTDAQASELAVRLGGLLKKHPTFGSSIMYGTDWHMCSKEPCPSASLRRFNAAFRGGLALHRQAFFAGNASAFLDLKGLVASGRNLPRGQRAAIQAFLSRLGNQ